MAEFDWGNAAKPKAAEFDWSNAAKAKHDTAAEIGEVGGGETFLNKAANAIPFGKQVVDANVAQIMAGRKLLGFDQPGVKLTPQARAEAKRLGMDVPEEPSRIPNPIEEYRKARDLREARTEAGAEQNPIEAGLGTGTGLALSLAAPMPKVAVGSGATGRILSGLATGAGLGGLFGLSNGPADLTKGEFLQAGKDMLGYEKLADAVSHAGERPWWQTGLDVLGSGAIGGGLGGGVISSMIEGVRPLAGSLKSYGISKGRKVLTNGADQLSSREAVPDDAVLEAHKSGAFRHMSTTQATAKRLEGLVEKQSEALGKVLSDLEALGVEGPEARTLAENFLNRAAELEPNTMNDALPNEFLGVAEKILAKAGGKKNLGLKQAESLKRSLQDLAKYGRVEETPLNKIRRESASVFRQANEDAIAAAGERAGPGSEIHSLGEKFVPEKTKLGNLIDAEEAAARGAARAEQRTSGAMPNSIDVGNAIMTGSAAPLAMGPLKVLFRNRLPSTLAKWSLNLAEDLQNPSVNQTPAWSGSAELSAYPFVRPNYTPQLADSEIDQQRVIAEALRRRSQ